MLSPSGGLYLSKGGGLEYGNKSAISGTIQRSSYFVLCSVFVLVNREVQDIHCN